jgi:hypothetical protein
MKASHILASVLILGLSFPATAQTPNFLRRAVVHGSCSWFPMVTSESPHGPVALGERGANGYSPWSERVRMRLDSQGRFQFACVGNGGSFGLSNETVYVRCPRRDNHVRVRLAPGGVDFECTRVRAR